MRWGRVHEVVGCVGGRVRGWWGARVVGARVVGCVGGGREGGGG